MTKIKAKALRKKIEVIVTAKTQKVIANTKTNLKTKI
tara:strand:- start:200 stop:310 length:111 start_codon:yes stop_codon:yes gene_type:complete